MNIAALFIDPNTSLKKVWTKMQRESLDLVVVTADKTGNLLGSLTYSDIKKALSNLSDFSSPVERFMHEKPLTVSSASQPFLIEKTLKSLYSVDRTNSLLLTKNLNQVTDVAYLDYRDNRVTVRYYSEAIPHKKVVLVTGGAGFLGSILVRNLLQKGFGVIVLDTLYFGDNAIRGLYENPNFEFIKGGIENIGDLARALQKAHYVVHLAGIVGDPACGVDPLFTIQTNFFATQVFIRMCKYYQIEKFVFASTCSVYGTGRTILDENSATNPISLYARSKLKAEKVLLAENGSGTAVTILRLATLHGLSYRPRFDLVANLFAGKAATDQEIVVQGGAQKRPLLHIKDATAAFIKVLESDTARVGGQIFNVGSTQENYTILELASVIKSLYSQTRISVDSNIMDKRDYQVNFGKIATTLGFEHLINLKDSLVEIIEDVRRGNININSPVYSNYLQVLMIRKNGQKNSDTFRV